MFLPARKDFLANELRAVASVSPSTECPICLLDVIDPVATPCDHAHCRPCIETWLSEHNTCPMCRRKLHGDAVEDRSDSSALVTETVELMAGFGIEISKEHARELVQMRTSIQQRTVRVEEVLSAAE